MWWLVGSRGRMVANKESWSEIVVVLMRCWQFILQSLACFIFWKMHCTSFSCMLTHCSLDCIAWWTSSIRSPDSERGWLWHWLKVVSTSKTVSNSYFWWAQVNEANYCLLGKNVEKKQTKPTETTLSPISQTPFSMALYLTLHHYIYKQCLLMPLE